MSAGLQLTLKHRYCAPAAKIRVLLKPSWRCLQDMIIPAFKPPAHVASSPLLGGPVLERTHLLFFRGDLGLHRLPNYSRGIRWGHMPTAHFVYSWHCTWCPAGIAAAGLRLPQKPPSRLSMAWYSRAARQLSVLTTCISGAMCTTCILRQPISAHHASDSSPVYCAGRGFTTCPWSTTGRTPMASPLHLMRNNLQGVTASGWHQANSALWLQVRQCCSLSSHGHRLPRTLLPACCR